MNEWRGKRVTNIVVPQLKWLLIRQRYASDEV